MKKILTRPGTLTLAAVAATILFSGCSTSIARPASPTAAGTAAETTVGEAETSALGSEETSAASVSETAAPSEILPVSEAFSDSDPDIVTSRDGLNFQDGDVLPADAFHGEAYLKVLIPHDEKYNYPQANSLIFSPGSRSEWHTHGGIIVIATGGIGFYQEEGKPAQILRKGDIINIPAGTRHWHGAAPNSWFSQIVIYDSEYQNDHAAPNEAVSDEDYANLEVQEYTGNPDTQGTDLTFAKGQTMNSENFSGPASVSLLIDGNNNAARASSAFFVTFDPGTIINGILIRAGRS